MSCGKVAVWVGVRVLVGVRGADSAVMDRELSGLQIPELAGNAARVLN